MEFLIESSKFFGLFLMIDLSVWGIWSAWALLHDISGSGD